MWKRLIFLAPSFSSSMLWWPGFGGTLAYFHANSPEKMEPNNFLVMLEIVFLKGLFYVEVREKNKAIRTVATLRL